MQNNIKFCEIRNDGESRIITGRAIVFESESNDLGFYEVIHRSAITQDVIDNSNILLTLNHKPEQVLARYNKSKNQCNMSIELREDGVYFSVDLPHTTLADDVLENIRFGNLRACSFAFTIPDEAGAQNWRKENGVLYREINKIDALYDLSVVYNEAYSDTFVLARNEELAKISNDLDMNQELDKEQPQDEELTVVETDNCEETVKDEELENRSEEQPQDDKNQEEQKSDDESENLSEEEKSDESEDEESEKRDINIKKEIRKDMKNFSLVKTILDVAEGRQLSAESRSVIEGAKAEMRNANLAMNGQIQLPYETRSYDVTTEGADLVEVKIQSVLEPLRAKNVAVQAGAKFISGLSSDIQVPIMGATSCAWATENGGAANGAGAFTSVKLSPKRLTTYIDLSKQLLIQSTPDVEALVYNDIVAAMNAKIEETIFGVAKTANAPVPMAWDKSTDALRTDIAAISNFKSLTDMEATIEGNGVFGELKYVISPAAKSALRNLNKSGKTTELVLQNGEVDGTPALSTGHIKGADYNVVYGDFSNLAIGQFGNIDITVDPYTQAANGAVRLVLNAYFDFAVLRPEAFAFGKI